MALLGARDTREGFKGATCGSVVQETVQWELPGDGKCREGGEAGKQQAQPDPGARSTRRPLCRGSTPSNGSPSASTLEGCWKGWRSS